MAEHQLHWFTAGTNDVHAVSALIGGFILIFGFVSLIVKERLYLSESLVATIVGIIIGPVGINLLDPYLWAGEIQNITLAFTEFAIAIQVMTAAVGLPRKFWKTQWPSLAVLYGPVIIWMWLVVALLIWLILRVDWTHAMILAACTAPTDPILANSIVAGRFAEKYISVPIRELLSGESAANDGLALPFFKLGILLLQYPRGKAWGTWFYRVWLYEVGVGVLFGAVVGYLAKAALRFSEKRNYIDKRSFLSVEIALATFILGMSAMFDLASFLAVFMAGLVFAWDGWFTEETEEAHVQEVVDNLINLTFFIYFGTIIPWATFTTLLSLPRLILLAITLLALRRLPVVLALHVFMRPPLYTIRDALLVGHFGPLGVGAVWYMAYAHKQGVFTEQHVSVIMFLVFCSVVVYGITAPLMHGMIRTLSVVRVYSGRTLSAGGDRGVAAWPSGVPMSVTAISGPIIPPSEQLDVAAHQGPNDSANTITTTPDDSPAPPGILIVKPTSTTTSSTPSTPTADKFTGLTPNGNGIHIPPPSDPAIVIHETIHIDTPASSRPSTPGPRQGELGIPPGAPQDLRIASDDEGAELDESGHLVDVGVRFRRFDTR
ncbi:uncharacterized protein SPPG_09069 [Spizellomyces punctatus DAOM BR117]|uniref:Cation/H+ exchanger transmembrane domain-containing protein n=1 Tax=Spizellomyces punctatus (strain DAOM BR117) TaxID=645134 RepID=A0A0L0HNP2_SPIPD|nr:uncharacterized protein SPPG_09069 [Spizellomyces punctatus DAOM BR117]KND02439.1 hypothetical protein SPPG_09069 [Spizellomyces punctatus DAOM BR117]|eukprot:XP_016610478.1 hypothetical protein SPPG_09069 [Spizellomyces punctatus DAOM BR117]